jgi:hypothetical protein
LQGKIDRQSFIHGMTTAFSECVSRESKRGALSPPFFPDEYEALISETEKIVNENGVHCWFDQNLDLPADKRVCWFVLYKFEEVLDAYKALRASGHNPFLSMDYFKDWLGYGHVWGEEYSKINIHFRDAKKTGDTVERILFPDAQRPGHR